MFNGKQIIQDTIDWVKVKVSTFPNNIYNLINGGKVELKEVAEEASYILGSERYGMEVTNFEVNTNVLTVTFKQAVNITGTNFLVKSPTLGINIFTLLPTVNEVFPVYKNVYKQSLSFNYPDTSLTEISDFEFISFGEYLNSLTVTSVERQADNNIYITFNDPHLVCDSAILGSNSIEIDCPEIGLVMSSLITYTPTSVNANQFRISKSGSVVAPFVPTYIRFYTGSPNSVLEKTRNGSQIIDNQLERFAFTNSTSRGFYMNNYINWKNGTRSARSITSVLNHIPDETGEVILGLTTNMSNFQSEGVNLIPNRPRLLSTTNYSSFVSSSIGNVAPIDISFGAFDSAYIPKVLNVLRHLSVQKISGTVTIICTSNHFLSVGDSVTVVSGVAGISGTVTILTASLATFTYTLAGVDVTAQADANGYNYRTGTSSINTIERNNNIVTITTATAHGIIGGSWINVTSPTLGLTNISYIAQNVTATTIQLKMTGSNVTLTNENSASINTSIKYTTRNLLKSRDLRTFGWYIAGTEPINTTTDLYFYDRNNVGFFANMATPTSTLGTWNFFVPTGNTSRSKFGRQNHFGDAIPTTTPPIDVNITCAGAIQINNTTTATPTDGIVSKLSNSDLNYVANTTWRGLLYFTGGTGANTAITTTANTILKTNGTLGLVNSGLTDNGTILKYNTQSVQRVATVTTTVSNITAGNLGHSYTQAINSTEVGSSITFETMLVKNADTALSVQISAVSNTALTESNGTPLLGSDYNLALLNGSIYKFVVTMVRTSSTNWKATTTLLATSSLGVADEVLLSYVGSFTNNITETLAIGLQFRAGTSSTADNVMSIIKIS